MNRFHDDARDQPESRPLNEQLHEGDDFSRLLGLLEEGRAFDALQTGDLSSEESEMLEILAALPHVLDPEEPSAQVRAAILEEIADETPGEVPSEAEVIPFRRPDPPPAVPATRDPWFSVLAASLILALLGVGGLGLRMQQQTNLVEELRADLAAAQSAPFDDFHMIQTTAGVADAAIPLYRVGVLPASKETMQSEAVVFLCGPHDHWYLNIRRLEAPPEGGSYHLWFLTEDGAEHAGLVDVTHAAQTVHDHLPDNLSGILITLETTDAPQQPGENAVLRGDETIML